MKTKGILRRNLTSRWSAKRLLEHPFFQEDPDVSVLSFDESKTKLTLQVMFKGTDKHTIKFDFDTESDTAETVVKEMVQFWNLTLDR